MRGFHGNIRGESSRRDLDRIGQSEFSQKWKFRRRQAKICGGKKLRIGKKCELFRFSTELSNRYGPETASDQKKRKDSLLKRQAKSPIPKESNEARNGHGPVWVITNCALDQREKTIFSPNLAAATGPLASGSDCKCFGGATGCVCLIGLCAKLFGSKARHFWRSFPHILKNDEKRWRTCFEEDQLHDLRSVGVESLETLPKDAEVQTLKTLEDARRRSKAALRTVWSRQTTRRTTGQAEGRTDANSRSSSRSRIGDE